MRSIISRRTGFPIPTLLVSYTVTSVICNATSQVRAVTLLSSTLNRIYKIPFNARRWTRMDIDAEPSTANHASRSGTVLI